MSLKKSSCAYLCFLILWLAGSLLGAESSSAPRSAETAATTVSPSDRQMLLSKIAELQAQLDTLKKQMGVETDHGKAEPTPATAFSAPAAAVVESQQSAAAQQERAPGIGKYRGISFLGDKVRIGGYGSMRFEANDVGGDNFVPGGSARGFTFRRFVITTDTRLNERLHIYTETEFERLLELEVERKVRRGEGGLRFEQGLEGPNGGSVEIEQAWGQFDFSKNHGFRFGVVLPPLGRYNINHDDDYWDIPRRTLTDRDAPVLPVKTAWRELGAGLVGHTNVGTNGKVDYQFYWLGGATLDFAINQIVQSRNPGSGKMVSEAELGLTSGAFDGTRHAQAVGYRVAFSPRLGSEIAFSGYHGRYTPSFLSISERVNAFGVDGNFKHKGFEVEGEFVASRFGNVQRVVRNFAEQAFSSSGEQEGEGLGSEIEFSLEGLARRRYGFWTDLKYHWRPAFLKNSFLGRGFDDPVLIPIFRYERVWLKDLITDLSFSNGVVTDLSQEDRTQDRFTVGLSYRPIPSFAFQLAYEHNQRRAGSALIFPALPLRSTNGILFGMSFGF